MPSRDAACDHDWRDIDGRWLCIECGAEKPYASDAANEHQWCGICQALYEMPWWKRLWWRFAYGIAPIKHPELSEWRVKP